LFLALDSISLDAVWYCFALIINERNNWPEMELDDVRVEELKERRK
jgi:hypothetical protein